MSNEMDIIKDEVEEIEKTNEELNYDELDRLRDLFDNEDMDLVDFNVIDEMLRMEDDKFVILSETFLNEIEKTINGHQEVFALVAKQKGYEIEEFQKVYAEAEQNLSQSNYSKPKQDFIMRFIGIIFNAFFENEGVFKRIITIPFELCKEVEIPTYAKAGDAGMDLYSPNDYTIKPGETIIIPTGIKMAIPKGYAILIQPRSGQSVKTKLRVANTPGLIDSGYRDEIGVIIENIEPAISDIEYEFDDNGEIHIKSILHGKDYTIEKGQRFAQMRLVEVPTASLLQVDSVEEIGENRNGGFGSSGTKEING